MGRDRLINVTSVDNVLSEVASILHTIDENALKSLVDNILGADGIFLLGTGRSGLVIKSFGMRLMQMGLKTHIVGDILTPAISSRDIVVALSCSGETSTVLSLSNKAKSFGAKLLVITSNNTSNLSKIADILIILPKPTTHVLPLNSAFEASAYLLFELAVIKLMRMLGVTEEEMLKRHSNLE